MKRMYLVALMVLTIILCVGCTSPAADATVSTAPVAEEPAATAAPMPYELTVAAAASLTDVTAEIKALYESTYPEATITFTYASSGSLQTQIEQGAPVDVFISAAQKQMNALEEGGFIQPQTRTNVLENKVVLIVPAGSDTSITEFASLTDDAVITVAMGDPASVPAGQYAEEVLTSLGIKDVVEAKANFGTDVRQVLTWVENGEVDAGIVYATDAATTDKVTIICEAPTDSVKQIIYPAAVLTDSALTEEAQRFIAFLGSDACADIFANYGFAMASE